MTERMTREKAREIVANLTDEQREAIAIMTETAESSGSYVWTEETGSVYEDSVSSTLNDLAQEFRRCKET